MQARYLYLYGRLGKELGRKHKIYVSTVTEAMKYLAVNFGESFYNNMKEGYYKIKKVTKDATTFVGEDGLSFQLGEGDLYLIPIAKGASQRGKQVGMIVAAVALAAITYGASAYLSGVALTGSAGAFTSAAGVSATFANMGWLGTMGMSLAASMALQGVAGLLTPTQKIKASEDVDRNESTSAGIINTAKEGSVVPVIYGQVKVGSVVISSGVYAERTATNEQYTRVQGYLDDYLLVANRLLTAYDEVLATTAESQETIISKEGGYSYYPGRYPSIHAQIETLRDQMRRQVAQGQLLKNQSITAFSLDNYESLLNETKGVCEAAEPILLSLYPTVGEVNDFYVVNDVYTLNKQSRGINDSVIVTSVRKTDPQMRQVKVWGSTFTTKGDRGYEAYYAVTVTRKSMRAISTMTPLDSCYYMNGTLKKLMDSLKVEQ